MQSGQIIILSGPSGVGKDTVIEAWKKLNPRVERVVAATTRDPRPGEVDGVDYHFLTDAEFNQKAESGEFLEYKTVHGKGYATPRESVDRLLSEGKIAVLKIDVQGAEEVRKKLPGIVSILLAPPTWEVLVGRITARGTEDPAQLEKRLTNARHELDQAPFYTHQVVNDCLDECVARLEGLVNG